MVLNHQLVRSCNIELADLAPLPTANLSSFGLHLTQVAARLILSKTSAGFHPFSVGVQT
jgi:hypothetical protein